MLKQRHHALSLGCFMQQSCNVSLEFWQPGQSQAVVYTSLCLKKLMYTTGAKLHCLCTSRQVTWTMRQSKPFALSVLLEVGSNANAASVSEVMHT